jgi:hypothetical protein
MASGSLKLYLSANSERLTREMDKSRKSVNTFSKKSSASLKKFAGSAALMATAVAASLAAMTKSALSSGDNLQKLSIRLNESTEALSQYQHVAEITGVSFEDITNSFAKLQKGIADADDGLVSASSALDDLGISIDSIIDLKPSQQFEAIADAINKVESPAKRTQIAMDLMGRSGSRMLSTMAEGGEGIRKIREEYDAMGGTLSQVDANQIANANDAITRIGASARITGQILAVTFADDIEMIARKIREFLPDLKDFFTRLSGKIPQKELEKRIALQAEHNEEMRRSIEIADERARGSANWKEIEIQRDVVMKSLIEGEKKLAALVKKRDPVDAPTFGGGDVEGAELAASIETKIQIIESGLLTEEQRLGESYAKKYDFIQRNLGDTKRAEEIKLKLKEDFESKLLKIREASAEKEMAIEHAKYTNIASGVKSLTSIVAGQSKKSFNLHKAASIAEAVVNAHVGITKALASANFPLAFAIGAAGAAQVAAIASTQYGSSSVSSAGISSSTSINDEPLRPTAPQQPAQPQPIYNIVVKVGERELATTVVEGLKIGQDNDIYNFETESGLERVIIS